MLNSRLPETRSTMQDALVRPIQRHDLPIVAAMMARIAYQQRDAEPMDVAILQSLLFEAEPTLLGLAAERFGCTVGYALLRRERHVLIVDQLVLMEGSRGLGLGRRMVTHMRGLADDLGGRGLVAASHAGMAQAAAFYAAVGLPMEDELKMLA